MGRGGLAFSMGSNPLNLTRSPTELGFARVRHFIEWSKSETSDFDWRGKAPSQRRIRDLTQRYFAGGTILITKPVGFSVAPNGPGTLLFTGGMLLR